MKIANLHIQLQNYATARTEPFNKQRKHVTEFFNINQAQLYLEIFDQSRFSIIIEDYCVDISKKYASYLQSLHED